MPTKYDGKKSGLPDKPEIPEAYLADTNLLHYSGPIETGMIFAWEPWLPHARELIIVAEVGTEKVGTYSFPAHNGKYKSMHWNDINRFRQAVVSTTFKKFPRPGAVTEFIILPENMRHFLDGYHKQQETVDCIKRDEIHVFNMEDLASDVAKVWTDTQYPYEFNCEPQPHRHFTHALLHVLKACGKLSDYVDALDHGGGLKDETVVPKALADIVISTQRMAQQVDVSLGQAIAARLRTLRKRYATPSLDDNLRYENSARIMFEQIHGQQTSWDKLTPEAQHSWRNVAKNHFVLTTQANVTEAEKKPDPWAQDMVDQLGDYADKINHPIKDMLARTPKD